MFQENGTCNATIAKAVPNTHAINAPTVIQALPNLGLGVAAGREVELIGLLCHLGDSRQVKFIGGNDINLHRQTTQITIYVGKTRLLGLAHRVGPILLRLVAVLRCDGIDAEITLNQFLEERHELMGLFGEIGHSHLWQHLLNQFTLRGTVINEDHAVQANVEFIGDVADIGHLIRPIDAHSAEMLPLEFHEWIAIPGLLHVRLIILTANRQNHPIVGQLQQGTLPLGEGITRIVATQFDAINAILTEHPTPQGIIKVEHKAFLAFQLKTTLHLLPPSLEIACQFWIEQGL